MYSYIILAIPDPELLCFDYFPIYYLLIRAILDSSLLYIQYNKC